jgi:hypothetical protein
MFLVQAQPLVGGINLKSSISNPQAASLVGAVNLKSTIGNLQLFDNRAFEYPENSDRLRPAAGDRQKGWFHRLAVLSVYNAGF